MRKVQIFQRHVGNSSDMAEEETDAILPAEKKPEDEAILEWRPPMLEAYQKSVEKLLGGDVRSMQHVVWLTWAYLGAGLSPQMSQTDRVASIAASATELMGAVKACAEMESLDLSAPSRLHTCMSLFTGWSCAYVSSPWSAVPHTVAAISLGVRRQHDLLIVGAAILFSIFGAQYSFVMCATLVAHACMEGCGSIATQGASILAALFLSFLCELF